MEPTDQYQTEQYHGPQTGYRDPLPLAKELWDRVGERAAVIARSRAFECNFVRDAAGALLWEDVCRLLLRDLAPVPHVARRLKFGAAL